MSALRPPLHLCPLADLRALIEEGLGIGPINRANDYRVIIAFNNRVVRVHVYYDIQNAHTFTEGVCGFEIPGSDPALADAIAQRLSDAINDALRQ